MNAINNRIELKLLEQYWFESVTAYLNMPIAGNNIFDPRQWNK